MIASGLSGARVRDRRAAWQRAADEVILPTLSEMAAALSETANSQSLGVYVQEYGQFENFSAAQLWFGSRPTGISYRKETRNPDGRAMLEVSHGVERGAALIFSQGETGKVVALAYPFATERPRVDGKQPTADPSRSDPWLGPIWEPEALTAEDVAAVCMDFLLFAPTTSIFWEGKPATPTKFKRPSFLQEVRTHESVDEILRAARRNEQIVGSGIAQLLTDLERLIADLDERQEEDFLENIEPLHPRVRKFLGKALEHGTVGFVDADDLRRR
jgi:hypothetical protein